LVEKNSEKLKTAEELRSVISSRGLAEYVYEIRDGDVICPVDPGSGGKCLNRN
jgi:hypothetical protein